MQASDWKHEGSMKNHMEINLVRADLDDAKEIHAMQIAAFRELLEKYQDFETSPAS